MNRLFLLLFGAVSLVAHAQVPDYVPTEGLVAWYPFNGNANDESGNGNDGVETNIVLTTDRFEEDAAFAFNGINSHIRIEHSDELNLLGDFTISIWFLDTNPPPTSNNHTLIAKRDDGGMCCSPEVPWHCALNYQQNGTDYQKPLFAAASGGSYTFSQADFEIFLNEWQHLVLTYSEDTLKMHLDGSNIHSNHVNPANRGSNSDDMLIGMPNREEGAEVMEGKIDDIGIWSRALTEEEILALYNAPAPAPGCTDPTACNFDAEANEDDGSCLSTLELSLQNQIQISSEGELVLTAPETLQNWTWDNGTSDSSIPIGSGGTFSIQGVIGVIPEIGSELNEGLIFDIDSLNQIVYIASPEEIGTGSEWGCYGTSTGATGQGMGDGLTNTQLILENCSDDNSAAAVASEYGENWYLPSFEELNAIRTQLHDNGFGDYSMDNPLSFNWYWSSTECSENPDWAAGSMLFSDGFYGACNNKDSNPGGVIAAKMVQGDFCLFTDTITIEVDCSESNDLSANGTSCGPGTYWDELESLCLPIENCQDDLDGDGVIGVNDLMQLLSSFGTDCAPTEEPETAEFTCGDPVSYHGYDYTTVQIGEQCWFAENLRTEHYANGDAIPWGVE